MSVEFPIPLEKDDIFLLARGYRRLSARKVLNLQKAKPSAGAMISRTFGAKIGVSGINFVLNLQEALLSCRG
jgi:hypothetical protein